MRYLLKYRGKYRVLAEYDTETNDFPRDKNGNIESSFDDLYIPCKKGKIYHYGNNTLTAYIPSIKAGKNVIEKLKLIDKTIVFDTESGDTEILFKFNEKHIDIVASKNIMCAKTFGCNISPFSTKNLPKRKYKIPKEDLNIYSKIISDFNTRENMHHIKELYADFDNVIIEQMRKLNKQFDINKEKRERMLKGKEFIHDLGMWNEFIEFVRINVTNIGC